MKLRTILLLGCMLVVPAWAMFSHTVPKELRKKLRELVSRTTPAVVAPPTAAAAAPVSAPASPSPAAVAGSGATAPAASIPATGMPAAGSPASSIPASPLTAGLKPTGDAIDRQPPAIVSQLADRTRQVRDQQARELQSIEAQLARVGAVGFDCQLLAGGEGLHGCSCRVPVDASGQLQRVFQAAGHDPLSAATALRDQVLTWKERSASMAGPIR